MAAAIKVTLLFLIVCLMALVGQGEGKRDELKPKPQLRAGPVPEDHHFVKREANYEESDERYQPAAFDSDNAFERPHRIRILPGYLH